MLFYSCRSAWLFILVKQCYLGGAGVRIDEYLHGARRGLDLREAPPVPELPAEQASPREAQEARRALFAQDFSMLTTDVERNSERNQGCLAGKETPTEKRKR